MGTVKDLLEVAKGELGNTESPAGSNRTKYGKWMGLDGQPWCMSFVQWCCAQAENQLPYRTGSCSALLDWYRAHQPDRIIQDPQPGDIIIYNFGHTGIVERAAAGTVTAIEGNTSPGSTGSQDNGGGVYRRTRNKTLVKAYIRPFEEDEDMDINKMIEQMTDKQAYELLEKAQRHAATLPAPDWAAKELAEAKVMGITDGSRPMGLTMRYETAIMTKRTAAR